MHPHTHYMDEYNGAFGDGWMRRTLTRSGWFVQIWERRTEYWYE